MARPRKSKNGRRGRKRAPKPRAQRGARQKPAASAVVIPECTKKYAYALTNPIRAHLEGVAGVCVPDSSLVPSEKRSFIVRGTFHTGGSGSGYVGVNIPQAFGGDTPMVYMSTSGNTATAATTIDSGAYTSVFLPIATVPWLQTSIGSAREMRVVAVGIRARYLGTLLNRGGRFVTYRSPTNAPADGMSAASMTASPSSRIYPVGSEWVNVAWTPITSEDFEYGTQVPLFNQSKIVLYAESPVANQPYEWECVFFVESIGSSIAAPTRTDSDVVGFGAAQIIAQTDNYSFTGDGWSASTVVRGIANAIRGASSFVSSNSADLATIGRTAYALHANRQLRLEL
jgi:hypothetical protein